MAGVMSDNKQEGGATMAQNNTTTTTKATPAEKLAERAKRTEAKAAEAKARAEAQAEKAAKAQAAAEQAEAKRAEREAAEAAKAAEADRVAGLVRAGVDHLLKADGAERAGLVVTVGHYWNLGDSIRQTGMSAKAFAEQAMVVRGDTFPVLDELGLQVEDPETGEGLVLRVTAEWIALAKAAAKAAGEQWQPAYLSKHNDALTICNRYADEAEAVDAAEAWAISTDPEHRSKSVRSFAKGESVNKAKKKGDPMTAKAAARLFAKAVATEGLTEDQAWALISEALESVAE